MWFGQTGLNVNANRFETGLSASVNGAVVTKDSTGCC